MKPDQTPPCVLVLGGQGFVGRHLLAALAGAGYRVRSGCRTPRQEQDIAIDFMHDLDPAIWLPRLAGADIVINAVGILHESHQTSFEAIHHRAPVALFDACVSAGVHRVLQISALGMHEDGRPEPLAYFATKKAADDHLLAQPIDACVIRPSLLFGLDGASSKAFLAAASLPLHCVPKLGQAKLQPLHIDDLCALVLALLAAAAPLPRVVHAVGGEALNLAQLLATYRQLMGLPPAKCLQLPLALARLGVRMAEWIPQRVASRETLDMLLRGNTADEAPCAQWLGRPPRAPATFLTPDTAQAAQGMAVWQWGEPLARACLALLWLVSGLSGLTSVDPAVAGWLAQLGLAGSAADITRIGAALVDLAFAVATVVWPRRATFAAQAGLVLVFTMLATLAAPAAWWHPFAPLTKNLPILALIALLWGNAGRSR